MSRLQLLGNACKGAFDKIKRENNLALEEKRKGKILFDMRREISYSKWPSNVLLIIQTTMKYQAISL